jgi:hypothetical protein
MKKKDIYFILIFSLFCSVNSISQKNSEITKKLINPLGYLSVPFQSNIDLKIPPNNAFRWTMNMMPIVPFSINKDFNSLNRIVLPIIYQNDVFKGKTQIGIGDLLINTFISPKSDNVVFGLGPSVYIPSGSPLQFTSGKWAAGPGVILMKSDGKLVLGALLFHLWTLTGDAAKSDFSFTYFQPVSLYNFNKGWGIGLSAEISNEWKKNITNGSLIFQGSKLMNISNQLVNFVLGPKLFFGDFNKPDLGVRFSINLLFP